MFILDEERQILIDKLTDWYYNRTKPYFSYTGPAGSGKTTMIKHFIEILGLETHEYIAAAYVGKAVMVLSQQGLPATTIHSLIYKVFMEPLVDENGDPVKDDSGKQKYKLKFALKTHLNSNIKLIIIDEASMVNDTLKDDILSFGVPVVFIGDMNQLPPIFGVSSAMANPDAELKHIMRQEEGNKIIQLSQMILHDEPIPCGTYGSSRVMDEIEMSKNLLTDYDIIICGKNTTREMFNQIIRENILKIPKKEPVIGDKIICRQNDWDRFIGDISLTNGVIGFIEDIDYSHSNSKRLFIDFRPDFLEESFKGLYLDRKYIVLPYEAKQKYGISKYEKFEYGYCITAHLSQGSQYDRVLFIDEPFYDTDTTRKLRYTAITRAVKSIDIITKKDYGIRVWKKYY